MTFTHLILTLLIAVIISTSVIHSTIAQDTLTAKIHTADKIGITIEPNYVGFSLEHDLALHWVGAAPNAPKPSFVTLMTQLLNTDKQTGPVFRIG
jgi:hypothetical protein